MQPTDLKRTALEVFVPTNQQRAARMGLGDWHIGVPFKMTRDGIRLDWTGKEFSGMRGAMHCVSDSVLQ